MYALLYSLAILPCLLIAIYLGWRGRILWQWKFWLTLLVGASAAILSYILHLFAIEWGMLESENFLMGLLFGLFAIGLSEELCKFLYLRYVIYPNDDLKHPFAGIRYGILLNMASAIVFQILLMPASWQSTLLLLAVSLPAYLAFGLLMGTFVAQAKVAKDPTTQFRQLNTALSAALVLHGLFYFFYQQDHLANLAILSMGTLLMALFMVARLRRAQPSKAPQREHGAAEVNDLYPPEEE